MGCKFDRDGLNGKAACIYVDLLAGARVDRCADELAAASTALDRPLRVTHNGREMRASPGETGAQVYQRFRAEHPNPETHD